MQKQKKKQRGITLIALVVSIIVLIILAGVSINMLVGENGIITQAQRVKKETEQAQVEEQKHLTMLEASVNMKNAEYYDSAGNKAIIPAGFAVSKNEGEREINEGLVIMDSQGNEFVWIPVTEEEKYKRNSTYDFLNISTNAMDDIDYLPEGITDEKQTVLDAGGFYIARYETGDESATEERVSAKDEKLASKKNQYI